MNPYMLNIGDEDDEETYITAPERETTPQPERAPLPAPTPVPAKPVKV